MLCVSRPCNVGLSRFKYHSVEDNNVIGQMVFVDAGRTVMELPTRPGCRQELKHGTT